VKRCRAPRFAPNDEDEAMSCPHRESRSSSRRAFLRRSLVGGVAASLGSAAILARPGAARAIEPEAVPPPLRVADRSARAPTAPVAIERCTSFEHDALARVLGKCLASLGGLGKLVSGKTVTVKLNTTGDGRRRLRGRPASRTYQTHPAMVEVLCGLMHKAGAKRIYIVESYYRTADPRAILASQKWDVGRIESAAGHAVAWEDTRNRGAFKDYAKLDVPFGGYVFPAYHLNRRYVDTDVLVTLAKMKNHVTAGITGAVKNLFGIAPTALYGDDAPNEKTVSSRGAILHSGLRAVPSGVTAEHDPKRERLDKKQESLYRVPMVTADLFGVRPIDLSIVEGIETCAGGEGPWCGPQVRPVQPGLVLAGRNAVTVDAIMTAVMGYDPTASTQQAPWFGYNHLELLARAGLGTHDPAKIEVAGVALKDALHEFQPGVEGWIKKSG